MNKLIKPYEFQAYYIPNIFTFPIITAALLQVHKNKFIFNKWKKVSNVLTSMVSSKETLFDKTYIYIKE